MNKTKKFLHMIISFAFAFVLAIGGIGIKSAKVAKADVGYYSRFFGTIIDRTIYTDNGQSEDEINAPLEIVPVGKTIGAIILDSSLDPTLSLVSSNNSISALRTVSPCFNDLITSLTDKLGSYSCDNAQGEIFFADSNLSFFIFVYKGTSNNYVNIGNGNTYSIATCQSLFFRTGGNASSVAVWGIALWEPNQRPYNLLMDIQQVYSSTSESILNVFVKQSDMIVPNFAGLHILVYNDEEQTFSLATAIRQ